MIDERLTPRVGVASQGSTRKSIECEPGHAAREWYTIESLRGWLVGTTKVT